MSSQSSRNSHKEEEKGKEEEGREENLLVFIKELCSSTASSELITQSECPLCGGLMGHSEGRLAVRNLLRNQLVLKITEERMAESC